eukprot:GHVP01057706.1.p2 GENE.GHVP01057706.1~~GHVP01057706.1.p2  ORF type:complete len:121 (+),score=9.20 GHVP01057706.1:402-764(+)
MALILAGFVRPEEHIVESDTESIGSCDTHETIMYPEPDFGAIQDVPGYHHGVDEEWIANIILCTQERRPIEARQQLYRLQRSSTQLAYTHIRIWYKFKIQNESEYATRQPLSIERLHPFR